MSVLVDKNTRLLVQGLGKQGTFHAKQCREYGTQHRRRGQARQGRHRAGRLRAVQHRGRGGPQDRSQRLDDLRPAGGAADAILEAADAGIAVIVAITEGIPVLDMARVKKFLAGKSSRLIGPNCPGVITPGQCKIGIMPGYIHKPGGIGLISRSGTLTYEAVWQLTRLGLGQSTCVGIGGDPIIGTNQIDALKLFQDDPQDRGHPDDGRDRRHGRGAGSRVHQASM